MRATETSALYSGKMFRLPPSSAGYFFGIIAIIIILSCETIVARTVRVGFYENPPKVFVDQAGIPRGIFIDIIEHIAKQEGWNLHYVNGTWDEGLTRLENDSIDIMPDVAFSDIRSARFDFNHLTVLCSWFQVFSRKNVVIGSIPDLEGKKIAVLDGSIQQQAYGEICKQLGFSFKQIALPDYNSTITSVKSGKADAAIVSRFYGYRREKEGALVPTSVILSPTALHFAAAKGRHRDLLDAIDVHVVKMLDDPHSVYYRSLAYWLHENPRMFIPRIVIWSIVLVSLALIFFFVLSMIFKWRVTRRTHELAEKNSELEAALQELKIARDEAIKRERLHAFGQLASGVAHDFNNLLVPIVSCVDQLLSVPGELENREKIRESLEVINTAARHGTEIVRRMQQFHRSVKKPVAEQRVDLNAVIGEVIELTRARLGKAVAGGTRVEAVLALGANTEITGRMSDIHEMMLNLVLNAADAMPLGGRLEITTKHIDDTVAITVKDSGVGMSDEIREKCRQPFFTTKGENGTGMGLAMVNTLVLEHGGRMEIVSAVGAGTSFIMTFPCAAVTQSKEQKNSPEPL
jgi:signal transduction histidine kinase